MVQPLPYLKETPSQTAGPYVHIGLIPHQAGFEIFKNNFVNVLAGTATLGSYTTLSTWMLESHRLGQDDQLGAGLANMLGSLVVGFAAVALGHVVGAAL